MNKLDLTGASLPNIVLEDQIWDMAEHLVIVYEKETGKKLTIAEEETLHNQIEEEMYGVRELNFLKVD